MRWLLTTIAAACLSGCSTAPLADVPNLAPVAPGVWRGGQPNAAGWVTLRKLGVTNVVKLNTTAEAWDNVPAGMCVRYLPITLWQQTVGEPSGAGVWMAVESIKPGTYVHCEHGQDRTGLVVAEWRVAHGWARAEAEQEMLGLGFHKSLRGLWAYWESGR